MLHILCLRVHRLSSCKTEIDHSLRYAMLRQRIWETLPSVPVILELSKPERNQIPVFGSLFSTLTAIREVPSDRVLATSRQLKYKQCKERTNSCQCANGREKTRWVTFRIAQQRGGSEDVLKRPAAAALSALGYSVFSQRLSLTFPEVSLEPCPLQRWPADGCRPG